MSEVSTLYTNAVMTVEAWLESSPLMQDDVARLRHVLALSNYFIALSPVVVAASEAALQQASEEQLVEIQGFYDWGEGKRFIELCLNKLGKKREQLSRDEANKILWKLREWHEKSGNTGEIPL